ncbi:M48 family metalloprotease [Pseudodesulfovibrio thermohalotolerans]|uniref:M48 family metalloprotease n=1 Tax=Pseudodesulfovibrio thermohalotolerans TaxID=2880651 RepID=UPI00244114FA|nr:M48 family metalloprotease [Pseudodesulfovibrio thermohalotolerans]WFS62954.1 M48 family metalloprotease [Pseudodesulfovibrio thermohalotolerans]
MKSIRNRSRLTRREFLKAGAMTAAAAGLAGCAKNPVTGQSEFMLVSEEEEIQLDRQASPQQLSNDYGTTQDTVLNDYVSGVGKSLSDKSHRPQMPYNYHVVNANYVNAYAFPGGTIACTRGILLEVDNEAEMAALLGHEIGHVNARHTASRMSSQMVVGGLTSLGGAAIGAKYGGTWGAVAGSLGGLGAGLLLASYSRDDERQADALGLEYMTRAEYNPDGMVGLMEMLNEQHDREPSALEVMFATHPMSAERLSTARQEASKKYYGARQYAFYRERYMDHTVDLRKIGPAIRDLQDAEKLGGEKKYTQAEEKAGAALRLAPEDYTGLLLMSKLLIAQEKYNEALAYARHAREVYPEEAQANQVAGLLLIQAKEYDQAHEAFAAYDKALPGNPYAAFYMGYAREGMGHRDEAAEDYYKFLQQVNQGKQAQHAYNRLVEWGYVR